MQSEDSITPILTNSNKLLKLHLTCFETFLDITHIAVLFYGSGIYISDLPLPRSTGQLWILIHEESPRNVPFMPYNKWLQHFNYTSTFSRYSDVPLTTFYLPKLENLTSLTYVIPVADKSAQSNQGLCCPLVLIITTKKTTPRDLKDV
uniref:Fucosyltransferase N-terminal domain-containing protein n=1 Tax=Glossina brevipalpis TaxID=37001 RepID=A0A1A9WUP0_9MUSC